MNRGSGLFSIDDVNTANIALTEICNMSCNYCPHSLPDIFQRDRKFIFPKDLYLRIVDYLSLLPNLKYVCLTDFNEFFLTSELTTFYLPALKERSLDYIIATNGSIVPNDLSYYKVHNPKYLVVGLQTITEEQFYRTVRHKTMSYESYIEKASELIKYFYENCTNTVISIEVAFNLTQTIFHKMVGSSYNKEIPSLGKQIQNIDSIISVIEKKTGIEFSRGANSTSRSSDQIVLAHSADDKVIFGAKGFADIVGIYDKLPTAKPPICFMEGAVFHRNGDVSVCCLDYKKLTTFSNVKEMSMDDIYRQYLDLVNKLRQKGSPFGCCRSCLGYYTLREKYARIIKDIIIPK